MYKRYFTPDATEETLTTYKKKVFCISNIHKKNYLIYKNILFFQKYRSAIRNYFRNGPNLQIGSKESERENDLPEEENVNLTNNESYVEPENFVVNDDYELNEVMSNDNVLESGNILK